MDKAQSTPASVEEHDDVIRKAAELVKRSNEMSANSKRTLIEQHMNNYMKIAVRCADVGPPYYGFTLKSWPVGASQSQSFEKFPSYRRKERIVKLNIDESLMLPEYVQIVQCNENMISSSPRFEIFDDRAFPLRKDIYCFVSLIVPLDEMRTTFCDGEISVFVARPAVALCNCCNENVETASDATDDCPGFSIDHRVKRFYISEFKKLLPLLRISLTDNMVTGTIAPGFNSVLKNWELGYGP